MNPEEVKAGYAKGVLTINLGKRAEARPKQIKVDVTPELAEKTSGVNGKSECRGAKAPAGIQHLGERRDSWRSSSSPFNFRTRIYPPRFGLCDRV